MKWKKIYNFYIGSSAIMLILLAVMSLAVIYPALRKIITIKNNIAEEKANLEKKLELGLNAKKIKEELASVEERLAILDTVFIPQGQELALLGDIEAIAAKDSVSVTLKPDFKGANMPNNVIRTPLNISAVGSFKNIMAFLNDLDGTDFYLVADQVSVAKGEKDSVALNLSGQIYVRTPEKK